MCFIALNAKRNQENNSLTYHISFIILDLELYYVPVCCKIWSTIKCLICEGPVVGGTQNLLDSECVR